MNKTNPQKSHYQDITENLEKTGLKLTITKMSSSIRTG